MDPTGAHFLIFLAQDYPIPRMDWSHVVEGEYNKNKMQGFTVKLQGLLNWQGHQFMLAYIGLLQQDIPLSQEPDLDI